MSIPHQFADRTIREALRDPQNLKELLEFVLGDKVVSQLDFDRVEYEDTGFLLPDLQEREADLLCRIPHRTRAREIHVCILIEHQSEPEHGMSLRMLEYGVCYWRQVWEQGPKDRTATLPAILPIVFFTGPKPWRHRRDLGELIQSPGFPSAQAPRWPIFYLNLAEHSVEELLSSRRAWHQAMAVVRAEHEKDVQRFAEVMGTAAHGIDKLANIDNDRHWRLLEFILRWATARRPDQEREFLYQAAIHEVRPQHQEQIRHMSSKIRLTFEEASELKAQQRYEEGKTEGKAEGELNRCRTLLRRLLEKRFGPLSKIVCDRIDASHDIEQLSTCIERAHDIASPDELAL